MLKHISQVSEAIVLSHERVDERPNFPYSSVKGFRSVMLEI